MLLKCKLVEQIKNFLEISTYLKNFLEENFGAMNINIDPNNL